MWSDRPGNLPWSLSYQCNIHVRREKCEIRSHTIKVFVCLIKKKENKEKLYSTKEQADFNFCLSHAANAIRYNKLQASFGKCSALREGIVQPILFNDIISISKGGGGEPTC